MHHGALDRPRPDVTQQALVELALGLLAARSPCNVDVAVSLGHLGQTLQKPLRLWNGEFIFVMSAMCRA